MTECHMHAFDTANMAVRRQGKTDGREGEGGRCGSNGEVESSFHWVMLRPSVFSSRLSEEFEFSRGDVARKALAGHDIVPSTLS